MRVEGGIAYFTEAQVMDWIGKAPATAEIYADDPQYDVILGGDRSWNAPAAGPTQILETDGTLRPANMADFVKMLKLYGPIRLIPLTSEAPASRRRCRNNGPHCFCCTARFFIPENPSGQVPAIMSRWRQSLN